MAKPIPDRQHIWEAIDAERLYQNKKVLENNWKEQKSVGEWLLIMEAELAEAKHSWIKSGKIEALEEVLQVVSVGVACLECCGVVERA